MKVERKVTFSTLGCRLNQYETQAIREQFKRSGYVETPDSKQADVFVLNTCTVTGESDKESRYLIRKFHRSNPTGKIVVTGCYVERDREAIEAMEGVTLTVLNREKSELLEMFESCTSLSFRQFEPPSKRRLAPLSISRFEGRTRACIKIQDGCNHACSFCKVVLARGPSRSRPFHEIVDEAKRLSDQGYLEVVLTGIQLGAYGYDLEKRQMLPELLGALSQIPGLKRIRLSSIEPTDVTEELVDAMVQFQHVCHHLHIPLQSGDDEVLKRMNRRYRRNVYRRLIQHLNERLDDFILTADVMVGFPGETNEAFRHTVELLEDARPYKLHIFPYSVREGTKAARFQDSVPRELIVKRRALLQDLERKWADEHRRRFVGKTLDVLVEENETSGEWLSGRTGNYIKVHFWSRSPKIEPICRVRVEGIKERKLVGSLC